MVVHFNPKKDFNRLEPLVAPNRGFDGAFSRLPPPGGSNAVTFRDGQAAIEAAFSRLTALFDTFCKESGDADVQHQRELKFAEQSNSQAFH